MLEVANGLTAYRIVKWWQRHSHSAQRQSGGNWICCPTTMDSLGLQILLSDRAGDAHFGRYVRLAEYAGRLDTARFERTSGILANSDGPLSVSQLAVLIKSSPRAVASTIERLSCDEIKWIDQIEMPTLDDLPPDADSGNDETSSKCHLDDVLTPPRARAQPPAATNLPTYQKGGVGGNGLALVLRRMTGQKSHVAGIAAGLTCAADAIAYWHDISKDKNANTVLGCMKHRIAEGEPPPKISTEAFIAACKAGIIHNLNGVDVTNGAKLGHNSLGLHVNDQCVVPTKELLEVQLA